MVTGIQLAISIDTMLLVDRCMCNFCYEARYFIASSDSKRQTCYSALSLSSRSLWLLVWKTRKASLVLLLQTTMTSIATSILYKKACIYCVTALLFLWSPVQSSVHSPVQSPQSWFYTYPFHAQYWALDAPSRYGLLVKHIQCHVYAYTYTNQIVTWYQCLHVCIILCMFRLEVT